MGKRIGRWAIIGTLPDGRTVSGQNQPPFGGRRTAAEDVQAAGQRVRVRRLSLMTRDIDDENRAIRETYGVPVR